MLGCTSCHTQMPLVSHSKLFCRVKHLSRSRQAVTGRCLWGWQSPQHGDLELQTPGAEGSWQYGSDPYGVTHPTLRGATRLEEPSQTACCYWRGWFSCGTNHSVLVSLYCVKKWHWHHKLHYRVPSASWIICCNSSGVGKQGRHCKKWAFLVLFPYSAMWICPPEIHKTHKQALKHLIWKISV